MARRLYRNASPQLTLNGHVGGERMQYGKYTHLDRNIPLCTGKNAFPDNFANK